MDDGFNPDRHPIERIAEGGGVKPIAMLEVLNIMDKFLVALAEAATIHA